MWRKIQPYVAFVAIALAVGALSAVLTHSEMDAFSQLKQPPLSPPAWLFPVVWTVLYFLMGVSMAMVWRSSRGQHRRDAVTLWGIQLAVNFFWTILFFNLHARLFAFIWLVLLFVCVVLMTAEFRRWNRSAAWLQVPYLLWLVFAAYLNMAVYLLNR